METQTNQNKWRLIISAPTVGGRNMAIDEAILEAVSSGDALPTLRIYSWHPYCLSLGHAQSITEIDKEYIQTAGWSVVRRPTGGRAILHADELTYSLCAPLDDPHVHGGVIESYRKISQCLLQALTNIGIEADSKPKDETEKHLSKDPVCFQYPSDYEITCGGKKLIGSAQARKANSLLQHGSVPLMGDITRIVSALKFDSPRERTNTTENLRRRATTLSEVKGCRISWNVFAEAMAEAFKMMFQIEFIRELLSPQEERRAKELSIEKYSNPSWTERL